MDERQVVTFVVAGETFGIGIADVQEIIPMLPVSRVPRTPPWIEGLVDLRGAILPVLSLRKRFDLPCAEVTPTQCIVVAEILGQPIGLIVDAVRDVTRLSEVAQVPPAAGARARFLSGVARVPEADGHLLLLLLDLDSLLSADEVQELLTS